VDESCILKKGKCLKDSDCDSTQHCVDHNCEARAQGCKSNEGCEGELVCVQSACVEKSPKTSDADGDTISDFYEGRAEMIDTDGDTTPDYLDTDSDNDTVLDSIEYGSDSLGYEPHDSDGDGIYDFRDDDSNHNGIADAVECKKNNDGSFPDNDGDGILNCHDMDNDNDGANDKQEIEGLILLKDGQAVTDGDGHFISGGDCDGDGKPDPFGNAENPWDCDRDGVPDYLDKDSDGDTIPDSVEGSYSDFDNDGFYNRYDLDSDGDTILDADEAGPDPTNPRDSDGDTLADFLDKDSDNDGLPDSKERELGTDPTKEDTDGDGVSDLIEFSAGTDPKNPDDNPVKNGDFVFLLPYQKPSSPSKGSMSFATSVQIVDLYFAIDSSGSMGDEIKALEVNLPQIISDTMCRPTGGSCVEDNDCTAPNSTCSVTSHLCVEDPSTKPGGCIADLATGLAFWSDCGRFTNMQTITTNPQYTIRALNSWTNNDAQGYYENPYDALACAVSGANSSDCPARGDSCNSENCAGFRHDAIRIVALITDAGKDTNYCDSNPTFNAPDGEDIELLGRRAGWVAHENNVKVVGFYNGIDSDMDSENALTAIVEGSGTVDGSGSSDPFIIEGSGNNVVAAAKNAVMNISKQSPLRISTHAVDIDAGATQFIESLEVNLVDQSVEGKTCTKVTGIIPGKYQGIEKLKPGSSVCYDLKPIAQNNSVQALNEPKVLRAKIMLKGDNSLLNERIAYFLIPPTFEEIAN